MKALFPVSHSYVIIKHPISSDLCCSVATKYIPLDKSLIGAVTPGNNFSGCTGSLSTPILASQNSASFFASSIRANRIVSKLSIVYFKEPLKICYERLERRGIISFERTS